MVNYSEIPNNLKTNNMAQETAVDFLIKKFHDYGTLYYSDISEAKAMEKEQMHKCASFWRGKENEIEKPMFDKYYKETYNK
jgi:hypothetical protein